MTTLDRPPGETDRQRECLLAMAPPGRILRMGRRYDRVAYVGGHCFGRKLIADLMTSGMLRIRSDHTTHRIYSLTDSGRRRANELRRQR